MHYLCCEPVESLLMLLLLLFCTGRINKMSMFTPPLQNKANFNHKRAPSWEQFRHGRRGGSGDSGAGAADQFQR